MRRFRNLLVGVDLSEADRLVGEHVPEPSQEAIRRAGWLAGLNSAEVTLLSVLPWEVDPEVLHTVPLPAPELDLAKNKAADVLERLADDLRRSGVRVRTELAYGTSWLEMIRRVLIDRHDLVIVGSRHRSGWKSAVLGSTGVKLLRKCPCPVWITNPQSEMKLSSILLATNFSEVSRMAAEFASSFAVLQGAALHVLHAVEFPTIKSFWEKQKSPAEFEEYRRQVIADAEQRLQDELNRPEFSEARSLITAHLETEPPQDALLHAIEQHHAELLVMGTIGRGGIPGMLVGNTAERLLPYVNCSILAVKPRDFVCPITIDETERAPLIGEQPA